MWARRIKRTIECHLNFFRKIKIKKMTKKMKPKTKKLHG